jgi:adenylate kinase family enzyme
MTRILITGWPRAGKTTLAETFVRRGGDYFVRHTDDLIGRLDWSAASAEVAKWMEEPDGFIIEGVSVARALRKYRDAHPGEPPPCDRLIYLRTPHVELNARQAGMGKGVDSVMAELEPWFLEHGLEVERP